MPNATITVEKQWNIPAAFGAMEFRVHSSNQLAINNCILAEWHEVSLPEDEQPEDKGVLSLFPVDDNKFCLELSYLQYAEASSTNATVFSLRFLPLFFESFPADVLMANQPFRFDRTNEQPFPMCAQTRMLLDQLQPMAELTPFIRTLRHNETAIQLLRCALECLTIPYTVCQVPACGFLAYESEREKIHAARDIIAQNTDQPLTIRELSRKVAMNECYLKKGFKTITGKTIHEYQQELRIGKAKELLQQQGRSVTDVANILGYNSISHFSTAFKRVTGLKPCELLK